MAPRYHPIKAGCELEAVEYPNGVEEFLWPSHRLSRIVVRLNTTGESPFRKRTKVFGCRSDLNDLATPSFRWACHEELRALLGVGLDHKENHRRKPVVFHIPVLGQGQR